MTSGGVAFNLQVAQVAILFDWRWNPASERLAMDRIHRANSNAFVYLDAGFDDAFVAARQMLKLRRGSHAHKSVKKNTHPQVDNIRHHESFGHRGAGLCLLRWTSLSLPRPHSLSSQPANLSLQRPFAPHLAHLCHAKREGTLASVHARL